MRALRHGLGILVAFLLAGVFCGQARAQGPLTITAISPSSGPVGSEVTITGLDFGTSQSSSTVALNGTAAVVTVWTDTSISIVVPSGATSGALSVTVNNETATSPTFTVTALPSAWSDSDIGSVGTAGSATYANGTFTVKASGFWASSSTSDAMHFVYQPLSGDGTIVARVIQRNSGTAGVMIRETLTGGSKSAAATSLNSYAYFFYRATANASNSYQYLSIVGLPYWVELVRSGNTFSSYASPDGVNWTQIGTTQTVAMATNVDIGLGVSSNNDPTLTTTTFDNVSISTPSVPAPVITSVSATTGSVGSQVVITGSGFGASQSGSVVTLNGVSLPVSSWSATSISVTIPSGATSGPLLVSIAPSMNDSNYEIFTVTSQPLPGGWLDADIGSVGAAGSATYANGTFTVKASGYWAFSGSDAMHFVYQPLSGDGTIVARVIQRNSGTAGVMIRETLTGGSKSAAATSLNSYAYFFYRATANASNSYQYLSVVGLPYWVKLVRSGNTFSSYASPDDVNWTQVGTTQTVTMATNVDIGLGVSSNNDPTLTTTTFDSVSISTPSVPAPVITSVSATTGPVGTPVVITGSGFGTSQSGSVVILSGAPVMINYWSATAINVTIPSAATSGPLLVSVAPSVNDSNYVIFTVTSQPLPAGWLDADIGSVGLAGSGTFSNGTFTVKGAGTWPLTDSTDAMHFVYQPLSGDGSIVARVVSRSTSGTAAGVMIRETLQAGSTYAATAYAGGGYPYFRYRATTGANSAYAYLSSVNLPYWVKVVRSGNTFNGYASPDGVNWTQIGTTQTVAMATNVGIGLGVSSNTSALATATFDNVSISTPSAPAPVITSVSATTGSVGSQVVITGSGFGASQSGSVVTLSGVSLPVSSWSATSISVTIPSGATSGPMLVSVAPSMNDSNYVIFAVTSQPLPGGWLDADIGSVGATGSGTFSNGTFTVQGAGTWPFTDSTDAMHFVYQPLSGDGSIVARIVSRSASGTDAGVMIRETLQAGSTYAATTYNSYPYFQRRATTGGSSTYSVLSAVSLPYWAKLVRSGNTFSSYASPDGVNWTQIGTSQTITMATNVDIGLGVSSNTSALATATFDNVVITSGVLLPTVTGVSPSSGTASMSVTVYGASFGSTQSTSTLTFDSTLAGSITSWSNNQIVATVPSTVQTGPVIVTVNSVQSNSNVIFTAFNPTITSLSPPAAPIGGTVTINGYGFGAAPSVVTDNGVQASTSAWTDTSILFVVSQGTTSGPVTVTMNGVTSNAVQLTIIEPLSITTISPTAGPVGTAVTITGTGFGATQSNSIATFNGATASISSWSDTQIVAVVPAGASTGQVTVEVADDIAQGPVFTISSTVQLTDSLGHQSSYTSSMVGGKWYVSNAQGSGCSSCTVRGSIQTTYDNNGNVLTRTDELGRVTNYIYDTSNDVASVSQPTVSGGTPRTTYTYNNFGEVLTVTDPLGHVTTNTYDSHGNLTSVTSPTPDGHTAASVTLFAYNSLGELTQITDPLGRATTLTYTTAGLIATISDQQHNVTTYQYDAHGNRTSVTDAMNNLTTFAYDTGDRLTTIAYPGGTTTTTFTYDYRGRRITATDQNGKTTTYAYDDADRLTSVTDAATNVTHYAYDTENNLLTLTDANSHATTFAYDAFGRVTQTTFPSNLYETYAYDAASNLTSKTDRKNQTIQYVYDALNRLTQKTYPDTTSVNYIYDLASKITQANDPTGTYGFSYDNMGRLTGTSTQYAFLTGTFTNSYSYDGNSNRTGFTAPDGSTNTYTYDTLNRMSTLANSWAGSFGFSYDALSRRTQMTRPNNVATNYSYDNQSRLLSVLHQLSGSTIDGATYTVDSAGNRTAKTDNRANVTSNYGYDAIYELLQTTQGGATTESYTYDPVGDRLSSLGVSPYSNNSSNELTSTPSASYTYDNNGNTLTKTGSGSTTNYTWDYENRLASVVLPGTGGTAAFKYDPFGRRIQKAFTQGSTTTTTNYVYDDVNSVQDVDQNGNLLARYTETTSIDEPLAESRSGTATYYQQDGLGSVTSLTSSAGAIANTYTYDSFGKLTASTGSITNRFQYTAREFDSETGLYFFRARYYDQTSGRFVSEDPFRWGDTVNFYGYVRNRPQFFRDPSGKLSIGPGFSPQCLADLLSAIKILKDRIKNKPSCNCFFLSNGLHAPLDLLLDNPVFTVNFDPKGNVPKGESDTLAYVWPGDPFNIYVTPKGCASGPTHLAQDLVHELAHISLGHTSGYYLNHPLPENPDHARARQAEAACGFAIQAAGTTITVTP